MAGDDRHGKGEGDVSIRRGRWLGTLQTILGSGPCELVEHLIMLAMATMIMLVVLIATSHLVVQVFVLLGSGQLDPANADVFRDVFGMFFTVLIGLEFRRSFLIVTGNNASVVRVRSIILIGMLATVRRLIVLDIKAIDIGETLATATAILALGIVYWLVRDQDRRAESRA